MPHFEKNPYLIARDLQSIKELFNFKNDFKLIEKGLEEVRFVEDLNQRRRKDAEILSLVAANAPVGKMLDIGTYLGNSAARMAVNSPNSTIYTINIEPEHIEEGGIRTTGAPTREEIGSFYRENNLTNVEQIFANTQEWQVPDYLNDLSVVYVDGCHDSECVYNDTKMIYDRIIPGGFILWHDCSPLYRQNYEWINDSMNGIEKFYNEQINEGYIVNFKDSWVGIYQKK